ncbi:hypothetical protein Trydic_g20136, partial [Trypoxylus dichotomus]
LIRTNSWSNILLTIFEFTIPVTIFLLTVFAKSELDNFDKVYVNETTYVDAIPNEDILSRVSIGTTMLLYAPGTQFADEIVRAAQLKLNVYNEMIKCFPTKEELIQYYNKFEHDGPTVVIFFNNIRHTIPDHLDYEIKIYEDGALWNTDKLFSNPFLYTPGIGSETYLDKAFAAVKVALDMSFIEMVTGKPLNTSLTYQEFPYPPHLNTDGVTTSFRYILPLITIIAFIFICPITLKRIVLEKSSGLKELIKIVGVKPWKIWLGWFLNGILVNAVSTILMAIVLTQAMFGSSYAIIEHCNVAILALFLLMYCSATITFFFAFSTWFNRATLAMVLGVLLWITSYIIFVGVGENIEVMNSSIKTLFLLFPPFGLYFGYNTISLFEMRGKDITFCNVFESPTESFDDVSLGFVIAVLLFDTVFFFTLTLYLDKIWPGEYGIAKPWYFLIQKIWKRITNTNTINTVSDEKELLPVEESNLRTVVQLKDVTKIYDNNVAVNKLCMNIYEGQITGLLGENGAGKSTTMSMITGLTKATSGTIYIDGINVNDDVEQAREKVSLCTQHNLLYDELTVIQHLELFGRILVLDEPTAGVDVESRKEIWDLILSFKKKRTVFISTHFLEEAEYLSDYIAIMNSGNLLCYGTPMTLKKQYEIGYKCLVCCRDQEQIPAINDFLRKTAPNAVIERKENNAILCRLSAHSKSEISHLLTNLDAKRRDLSISYKLSCSTLEDLYLKVQDKEMDPKKLERLDSVSSSNASRELLKILKYGCFLKKRLLFFSKKKLQYLLLPLIAFGIVLLTLWLGTTGFADVSKDGTRIRLELGLYGNTDVYYSIAGTDHQTEIDKYFKNIVSSSKNTATKVNNVSETIVAKGTENIVHYMKRMLIAAEFTVEGSNVNAVNIMHANKAYHGAPISIDVVMNTLLKYYAGDKYAISTSNAPLHAQNKKEQPLTQSQFSNVFLWVTLLPIGSLLIASTALLLPTTEHMKSTRILDSLCGIKSWEYWILNFLFDALFLTLVISIILFPIYFIPVHFMDVSVMVQFWLVLLVYGIACIPFVYSFTHADTVETAYARFLIVHIIFSPIVAGFLLAMEEAETSSYGIKVLKNIWFVGDPHVFLCFYLAKFSIKMILNHNWEIMPADKKNFLCSDNVLNDPCCRPDSLECSERRTYFENDFLCYAIGSFMLYMFVLWMRDILSACIVNWFFKIRDLVTCKSTRGASIENSQTNEDTNIILKAKEISKRYFTPKWFRLQFFSQAVKNLSFELRKGTCLGLLGVNGAGKSTSFRILTKEVEPTTGKLDVKVTSLGYCPQQNALIDEFTGREILIFYGQLRNQFELINAVDYLLNKFGLEKIADRPCGTYSGGNKRKLSTCISIIGNPTCILLDEPTSGIDPVSRRELWDLIEGMKSGGEKAILLTSHSMDECEALCDRLCILKEGTAVKEASIENLKKEYCVGHIVDLKFKKLTLPSNSMMEKDATVDQTDANNTSIREYLYNSFEKRNVEVLGTHNAIMRIQIRNSDWSTIFEKIEALMADRTYNIEDYWVKEASLAEVLNLIAKDNFSKSHDSLA